MSAGPRGRMKNDATPKRTEINPSYTDAISLLGSAYKVDHSATHEDEHPRPSGSASYAVHVDDCSCEEARERGCERRSGEHNGCSVGRV